MNHPSLAFFSPSEKQRVSIYAHGGRPVTPWNGGVVQVVGYHFELPAILLLNLKAECMKRVSKYSYILHIYIHINWEWLIIPTAQRTPSFFRGVGWNHQPDKVHWGFDGIYHIVYIWEIILHCERPKDWSWGRIQSWCKWG
jgi:hypothetical protein